MSELKTFLVQWYPNYPYSDMHIWQLDCLKDKYQPPISQYWNDTVKDQVLEFINYAMFKHDPSHNRGLIWHYNNSVFFLAEAKNIFDFIDTFKTELKKSSKPNVISKEELENLMRIIDSLNIYEKRPQRFMEYNAEKGEQK